MFINDYDDLPLEAIVYCIGQCNYGGRVTDDKDRRCLLSIMDIFFNDEILTNGDYSFSPSGDYKVPPQGSYESYIDFIKTLPQIPHPEIFGMHANADISKDTKEVNGLFNAILLTLPRASGGGGKSTNDIVDELCESILKDVPPPFDTEMVGKKYPVLYEESMNTVLTQECVRFNRLIAVVRGTLSNIRKAIVGLVVMSEELEAIFEAMTIGKIPGKWAKSSYPSLKPLGSYVADLSDRLKTLQNWIDNGKPAVFWLSGFFFTQAFLTGIAQNYARKYTIAIDKLVFEFKVRSEIEAKDRDSVAEGLEDAALTYGLFLEGARWDRQASQLAESLPKVLFDTLPLLQLTPVQMDKREIVPSYACPVYKTSERKGVLATTGHSSNFVMMVDLPTDLPESHWINRGTAFLCGLDN